LSKIDTGRGLANQAILAEQISVSLWLPSRFYQNIQGGTLMPLTLQQANEHINSIQHASRQLAFFYETLLPILDQTAKKCCLDFYQWEPIAKDSLLNTETRPSTFSAWSFLPLDSSYHLYGRCEKEDSTARGDVMVAFLVQIEDIFMADKWKNGNISRSPGGMVFGRAVLEVFVYRSISAKRKMSMLELFLKSDDWVRKEGWQQVGQEAIRGYYLNFDLADFLVCQDKVIKALMPLLTESVESEI
jgi:hypothetical protein